MLTSSQFINQYPEKAFLLSQRVYFPYYLHKISKTFRKASAYLTYCSIVFNDTCTLLEFMNTYPVVDRFSPTALCIALYLDCRRAIWLQLSVYFRNFYNVENNMMYYKNLY